MIHKIGSKAVTYMEQQFMPCNNLVANFAKEDNVPLTDGEIRIYRNPTHSNDALEARLKVQVKGQPVQRFGKKYSIERPYLEGLRASGGVLLLVAQVQKTKDESTKGYYRFLFPGEIDEVLGSMKTGQKSTSISLSALPNDSAERERIVRLGAVKQRLGAPVEFTKQVAELTKGFNLTVAEDVDLTQPVWFGTSGTPAAVTARFTDDVAVPVTGELVVVPESYFLQDAALRVRAGDIEFVDVKSRLVDASTVELFVSPGIRITKNFNDLTGVVTYVKQERLDLALKDIDFFQSWMATGEMYLNDQPLVFQLEKESPLHEIQEQRGVLSDLFSLFEALGADISLVSYQDLDRETLDRLRPLVEHVVYGAELTLGESRPMRYELAVGSWILHLVVLPQEEDGKQVFSLADPKMGAMAVREENRIHTVTAFELLRHEDLAVTINLFTDDVVRNYAARVSKENAPTFANRTTLNLLLAADQEPRRRRELVSAAQQLNDWNKAQGEDSLTNLLNRAQILWRQGALTDEALDEVRASSYGISGIDDAAMEQRAGCAIVLGDKTAARHALAAMSANARRNFLGYPIAFLLDNYALGADYLGPTRNDEIWEPVLEREREQFVRQVATEMTGKH